MKILYFVNYFYPLPEAAAINAFKISEFLVNYGHQVILLFPSFINNTIKVQDIRDLNKLPNLRINYSSKLIKYPLSFTISHFENLLRFVLKLKNKFYPNIILSQYHPHHYASVAGGYLSKLLKIPHLIRSHDLFITDKNQGSFLYQLYNLAIYPPIHNSISNCNTFYVTTSEMKNHLLKFKKFQNLKIEIHHNGIDINQFYPFKDQDTLKEEYGCDTIMSFNGLIKKKFGFHNFLHALPKILKEHKDTHFNLVGYGPDINYVLDFIKRNNLDKQFHYLGVKPHIEIPFYVNNCDIGIGRFTNTLFVRYCMPTKVIEYMACRKPFITTPVSEDVVKNDDCGLILNPNFEKEELFNKLTWLIEDKSLRKKLGEIGLKKVQNEFNWDIIMTKFNRELKHIKFNVSDKNKN